jgi:glycosyltransferase involved in cell wall biosynthesis
VTPENPKLFVNALEDAFNNKDKIESMGANARALAERDFDRAHLASNWGEWVLGVKQ